MNNKVIRVGARKSQLSLTQTGLVMDRLRILCPDHEFRLKTISTTGDRVMDPAALLTHQGIFVKEIEEALLGGEIDLGVHSLKDMPCDIREGLDLGAVSEREDPRDAFLSRDGLGFRELKAGARVGTSSVRRRAQVLLARRDLQVCDMRGNVDTRLRKLASGTVDALVIACAGLVRLGQEKLITERMGFDTMVPAPCQGVLALEIRQEDQRLKAVVGQFDHAPTRSCITAERSFLKRLGGGCSLPVGALARVEAGVLTLTGQVIDPGGHKEIRRTITGPASRDQELGRRLAEDLLQSDETWMKAVLQTPWPKK